MIYINDYSSISAVGNEKNAVNSALCTTKKDFLTKRDDLLVSKNTSFFGVVQSELPDLSNYKSHFTRNNQFLAQCVEQIKSKVDYFKSKYPKDRIGIVMGTSTSGLEETEHELERYLKEKDLNKDFYYNYAQLGDPSMFLAEYLDIEGPCYTISTACSSSSRALISAKRMIECDLVDVVIAGGADTLCQVPINGFDSMSVLSYEHCIPFSKDRHGINIGEGGGLMFLSKEPSSLALLGVGESSDAYHVSSPDPSGEGAISAIKMALANANLKKEDIGYINMHGTSTKLNDAMESTAIAKYFGTNTPCSSTKHLTGHTLGAAGILEASFLCNILENNLDLPIQDFSNSPKDPELLECGLVDKQMKSKTTYMMSNSFAFGGNNTSIIIGKV